jgi:predicted transcriptional regulator of viral defense system
LKSLRLQKIKKTFFSFLDIAKALEISPESARVAAHRYTKNGVLVRIKPNIYTLAEKWRNFSAENLYQVANLTQVPSYISLTTTLEYYGVTTQIQQNYIECICTKRTYIKEIGGIIFRYSKISENLYFGFEKRNGFYIALPEKALLDAVYLMSLGRYSLDIPSLNVSELNSSEIDALSKVFPKKTKNLLRTYGFISPT